MSPVQPDTAGYGCVESTTDASFTTVTVAVPVTEYTPGKDTSTYTAVAKAGSVAVFFTLITLELVT
jgi:hypothetical protein